MLIVGKYGSRKPYLIITFPVFQAFKARRITTKMEVGLQNGYVANGGPPPPSGILAVGEVQRTTNR